MSPSFEANYSAPPTIPLFVGDGHLLSDVAVARLTSLRQRTSDLHSAIPSFEDIAPSDQKQDHQNRSVNCANRDRKAASVSRSLRRKSSA